MQDPEYVKNAFAGISLESLAWFGLIERSVENHGVKTIEELTWECLH